MQYRTKLKAPRRGVCTTYLAGLVPSSESGEFRSDAIQSNGFSRKDDGIKLRIGIKKGTITLPDAGTPLICVGPGTGVAPMRAILQKRIDAGANGRLIFLV